MSQSLGNSYYWFGGGSNYFGRVLNGKNQALFGVGDWAYTSAERAFGDPISLLGLIEELVGCRQMSARWLCLSL